MIIDGRPFTWEEVGKMVMSYEGFQMKLKMADPTEDVDRDRCLPNFEGLHIMPLWQLYQDATTIVQVEFCFYQREKNHKRC